MLPIKTIIFLKVTIVGEFYKVMCEKENKLMNKITIKDNKEFYFSIMQKETKRGFKSCKNFMTPLPERR